MGASPTQGYPQYYILLAVLFLDSREGARKSRDMERTCGEGPVGKEKFFFSPRSNLTVLLIARALSYFARPLDYPESDC